MYVAEFDGYLMRRDFGYNTMQRGYVVMGTQCGDIMVISQCSVVTVTQCGVIMVTQ